MFGSTDKVVEEAIANGNYKKIDMEYVEDNGISIKVDYVVVEDNSFYIAFNVLSEEEFDEIHMKDLNISDQNDFYFYSTSENKRCNMTYKEECISNKNSVIIYNFKNEEYNFKELRCLKIKFDLMNIIREKENEDKKGKWNFNINL